MASFIVDQRFRKRRTELSGSQRSGENVKWHPETLVSPSHTVIFLLAGFPFDNKLKPLSEEERRM